jgi:dephospho-CoA kinase
MKVIALTGWSGSGKDTLGQILAQQGCALFAFAAPLKDTASELFGFPRGWADTQMGKRTAWRVGYDTLTIRDILLRFAKLDRERFGDDIYARETIQKFQTIEPFRTIVITDLRYPIELQTLFEYQNQTGCEFEIWRVKREGQTTSPVDHPSEHLLDNLTATRTIVNPGTTIEAFEENVFSILRNELSHS